MKAYTQLTLSERIQIYALIQQGKDQETIAQGLGRNPSTISRELRRNQHAGYYRPEKAHLLAEQRRIHRPRQCKFNGHIINWIECRLNKQWSPEQISGRLFLEKKIKVSHEWIYQWLLANKKAGGLLWKNLRRSNRRHKKRYGSVDRRGQIKNRISIEKRPEIVAKRERLGDLEGDLVCGKNHKGHLVTLNDRVSLLVRLQRTPTKECQHYTPRMTKMIRSIPGVKHTLTLDNGKEAAGHQHITRYAGVDIFFAHPYSAWERGCNENINGLVRQYFPKSLDFRTLTDSQVKSVEKALNSRPRKKLGYLSPNEFHQLWIQKQEATL